MTKSCIYYNFGFICKDKLFVDILKAFTKINDTFILIFIAFCTSTFAPTSVLISNLPGIYINIDLQKVTKLALKFFIKDWVNS